MKISSNRNFVLLFLNTIVEPLYLSMSRMGEFTEKLPVYLSPVSRAPGEDIKWEAQVLQR